ncbi:DNA mismatch repair protein MutS [Novosphingobium marinum]|uniref:DNA-nicking Smr family endonuclease n=1 Tax=Novosphingobium marinum TaxID=1514948 RepID=A0A7Y9XV68_9SPHN|nr:Smr/MutS family protein [Novosphingobium marinum]NYH95080.1 DNA-nicking Smr family endonuclease [Novosphingobium marinum]GGC24111.1 DNA mismatch repair protein MutS [Novosphingobium marinum]
MKRPERKLTGEEAELWRRVAKTVTPIAGKSVPEPRGERPVAGAPAVSQSRKAVPRSVTPRPAEPPPQSKAPPIDLRGLDASWDRKLGRGLVEPDFTLDLHGASLDAAHGRLLHGLSQAKAMGARLVLLVTGRPRPGDAADRGHRRGAIRAKVVDWLAVSEHALDIAAIRKAHRRHGGAGALYIVLRRRR